MPIYRRFTSGKIYVPTSRGSRPHGSRPGRGSIIRLEDALSKPTRLEEIQQKQREEDERGEDGRVQEENV